MDTATFWNKKATKYASSPIPHLAIYEKKLEITQSHLTPKSNVLEIGCGTGTTALHHAPFAEHIDAWDISQKMLNIAAEKQKDQGIDNINFQCSAQNPIQFKAQHYDMVMTHSLLHLVDQKEAMITELYNTLKPGGIFISSTPCLSNKMLWLKPIAIPMHYLGLWPKVYFFTSQQLEHSITKAGFNITKSWLPEKAIAHFFVAQKPH